MRCAARILNLTEKEGLKVTDKSILKVRNDVRFVKSSPARTQKFKKCVNQERINCKRKLVLDVETRWNTTHSILDCAYIYRRAFDTLEVSDGGKFKKELEKNGGSGTPTDYDWDRIYAFLPYLKMFYDTTLRLSGSLYTTRNVYLEELVTVSRMIATKCKSQDLIESMMATEIKNKHDTY
ncbi:unnamed protein product [Amaranthus hypochondriacus]